MSQREGYKKTEIGWIPEDWEFGPIKSYIDLQCGFPFKSSDFLIDNGAIKLLRGVNITEGKLRWKPEIDKYWETYGSDLEKYLLEAEDLVVSMDGSKVGRNYAKIRHEDLPLLLVQRVARIRAKRNLIIEYLYQFIGSSYFCNYVDSVKTSSGIPHISATQINSFSIPLPPLPEQQKIASILSSVDDKISSIDSRIQQTEQLKKGLMEKLLTEGIGDTEFKDTEIGRIPKGWSVVRCDATCKKITDGEHLTPVFMESGMPLVSAKDIEDNGVNFSNVKYVSENDYIKMSNRCNPEYGDILMVSRGATIGRTAYNNSEKKFSLMGSVILLKTQPEIIFGNFLVQYLKGSFNQKSLLKLSGSSAQQAIYLKDIKKLILPLPPLPEQQKIASILSSIDDKIETLSQKKSEYQTLKKGLMAELLTGKRRVKV